MVYVQERAWRHSVATVFVTSQTDLREHAIAVDAFDRNGNY